MLDFSASARISFLVDMLGARKGSRPLHESQAYTYSDCLRHLQCNRALAVGRPLHFTQDILLLRDPEKHFTGYQSLTW